MTRHYLHHHTFNNEGHAGVSNAVDLETAAHGVNEINRRIRNERREGREIKRAALAKAKITLPKMPWDK